MDTGLYISGVDHKSGNDIPVTVVDTGERIRVERWEFSVCKDAMESDKIFEFKDKTALEILQFIHEDIACRFDENKTYAGNHIVCKNVILDDKLWTIKGTVRHIFDVLQKSKHCKLSNVNGGIKKSTGGMVGNRNILDVLLCRKK